ncbi:hypothetical protein FOA52_015131 [Chlamydomonas sp. UWO 241]|nr:hypothetical protein FOA52_015131 [Chlamydomonas sp. UWO 241]
MQPLIQADAAGHADEAEAGSNLGASVLLNGLLFAHVWGHMDAGDKRQLRAVGRGVRALTDGLIVSLSMHGNSAADLASALARWPHVQRLEADCDAHGAVVISAAPLAKLRVLVLYKCTVAKSEEWSMLALSRTAAAGLQELHVSTSSHFQYSTLSIEAVRGCAELRKLSVKGCYVSDLGPLADCDHLEDLSTCEHMGSNVSDLAPLGGCAKLKKLSIAGSEFSDLAPLRGCVELLYLNVGACGRLVSLKGLQGCSKLECLDMACLTVSSLEPLSGCGQLKRLDMGYCSSVASLAPLSACTNLTMLNMRACTSVASVEPLTACVQLEELSTVGLAEHLRGLAALKAAMPRLRVVTQPPEI